MLGITIELGSYSVKFLTYQIDKKKTILLETEEILTDYDTLDPNLELNKLWENQVEIIAEFLEKFEPDTHIMITLPAEIISTRFITLPVKSKKLAINMLPFQIEEDLPYSLQDCHWAESMQINNNQVEATVAIVKKEHFNEFFYLLKSANLKPKILTSDVSSLSSLVNLHADKFPKSFCIIDLGHHATRSFFFHNGKLVSNHHSYVAGAALTEAISKTYSISIDEATMYKHQNSFLLVDDQYEKVNENQREFAKIMDATLSPLMSEIKRWDIGFRVTHGVKIEEVYICGGTSNIKNMKNYLSSKLEAPVKFFDPYQYLDSSKFDNDDKFRNRFSQLVSLATNATKKSKLINFLKNEYTLGNTTDLPFEGIAFIGVRLSILSFIVSFFLFLNFIFIDGDISKAKKISEGLFKNPQLNLSKRYMKMITKSNVSNSELKTINQKLKDKKDLIKQEVNIVQASLNINAFSHLSNIIRLLSGSEVEIISLSIAEDETIDFILHAKDLKVLEEVQKEFSNDKKIKWLVEMKKDAKQLIVAGKGSQ